jgi:hypothetical protein
MTTNDGAVRLIAVEPSELLGIAGTVHAGMLEALAAVLAANHVFDDLSERNARRVAGAIAFEAIHAGWAMTAAADAVTDRAIAAQLDRGADFDDRMAVGLALHQAARVLGGES